MRRGNGRTRARDARSRARRETRRLAARARLGNNKRVCSDDANDANVDESRVKTVTNDEGYAEASNGDEDAPETPSNLQFEKSISGCAAINFLSASCFVCSSAVGKPIAFCL